MKKCIAFIIFLAIVNFTKFSLAQQFNLSYLPIDEKISIGLKFSRAFLKDDEDISHLSGIYKFYGNFPLKNNWQINAEIPLVVVKWNYNDFSESETGFANIYLEFQKALKNKDKKTCLNFGIYIPTIGSDHYSRMFLGILSDVYRFPQYTEGITLNATFAYNLRNKPGAILGIEFGPDLYIPTVEGDVEFLLHYGLKGGYRFNKVSTWAEFGGTWVITEEGSLDENTQNQIFLGGQLNSHKFRPGIFYGFHINKDFRTYTNGILGLNIQVVL